MEVAFTKAEQLEQLPFIATPWGVIVVGFETPIIVIPIYYQLKSFLLVSPTIEKLGIIENLTNNVLMRQKISTSAHFISILNI